RSQVHFMPDPLLVEEGLTRTGNGTFLYNTCWIMRGPVDENHAFVASVAKPDDVILGFEPKEDEPLTKLFPNMIMINKLEEFNKIAIRSRRIVSMRFHGVILS